MSRLAESYCEDDEAERENEFARETAKAYAAAKDDLHGFLRYLDAMPKKSIIADRFFEPNTGETCAVASFCRHKGMTNDELERIERASMEERAENGGVEEDDGWGGATVRAGEEAGLPADVAYDLAWKNDVEWTTMTDGYDFVPPPRVRLLTTKDGTFYGVVNDPNGTHTYGEGHNRPRRRPMTNAERWLKMRNYVAGRIGEPKIASA